MMINSLLCTKDLSEQVYCTNAEKVVRSPCVIAGAFSIFHTDVEAVYFTNVRELKSGAVSCNKNLRDIYIPQTLVDGWEMWSIVANPFYGDDGAIIHTATKEWSWLHASQVIYEDWSSVAPEPDQQDIILKPSSWAKDDIEAANREGLVSWEAAQNLQAPLTRLQTARLLWLLVEKDAPDQQPIQSSFADTQDESVRRLSDRGTILGDGDGHFDPDRYVSRAEAVTMLYRENGDSSAVYRCPFDDVPSWAMDAVGWAAFRGITNGTGGSRFSSSRTVTAEEFIAMELRCLEAERSVKQE